MKDWTGNKKSTYTTLGASNHSKHEREQNDYYATDPIAGKFLMELEDFQNILEPACGEGHLSEVFKQHSKHVVSSDVIDRGYGLVMDFFDYEHWSGDIITNPPYRYAKEFVEHSLKIIRPDAKVAMFLKLQFLESRGRRELFDKYPPRTVYVTSKRIGCAFNGEFTNSAGAVAYAWFVWVKGFQGNPEIKWFN